MDSVLRLFKAVVVPTETKTNRIKNSSRELLQATIPKGFIFAPMVVSNFAETTLLANVDRIAKEIGLSAEEMNSSFHKSWTKIRDASIEQLVLEQALHYLTTYGFEALGIYSPESIYIPAESLDIPELTEDIMLTVIRGYTKAEIKGKLLVLLQSGIALKQETVMDAVDIGAFVGLSEEEIATIRNKEAKAMLYDFLGLVPAEPIEFLRYAVYKSTKKSLLIKDQATIDAIKGNHNLDVLALFTRYEQTHGLHRLAEIFHRFKPLFLAFKGTSRLNYYINRIRKLADVYHKPMAQDLLNDITAMIKRGELIDNVKLHKALDKANSFRKIRLAYALRFRTTDADSIVYKIRNGKGYADSFRFRDKETANGIMCTVLDSLAIDMHPAVRGKKVFIPEHVDYALPATEKQFTGDLPSGTSVFIPSDAVIGIHWNNVKGHRIDLDLSVMNADIGKIGWDSLYRTGSRDVLFSGDMTDARGKRGASELFYIQKGITSPLLMVVNYFNFNENVEVPFKILAAKQHATDFDKNYMVDPNNVLAVAKTVTKERQKVLGLIVPEDGGVRFYFSEVALGNSITSTNSVFAERARRYLYHFLTHSINLNDVLYLAGATFTGQEDCDIDLSPENLERDTIINLIKG